MGHMFSMSQLLLEINLQEPCLWLGRCFLSLLTPSRRPILPPLWSTYFHSKNSILGEILGKQEHMFPIPVCARKWENVRKVCNTAAMIWVVPPKGRHLQNGIVVSNGGTFECWAYWEILRLLGTNP